MEAVEGVPELHVEIENPPALATQAPGGTPAPPTRIRDEKAVRADVVGRRGGELAPPLSDGPSAPQLDRHEADRIGPASLVRDELEIELCNYAFAMKICTQSSKLRISGPSSGVEKAFVDRPGE